jgi:ankyrin repeat protein
MKLYGYYAQLLKSPCLARVDAAVTVTLKLRHGPLAVGNRSVLMTAAPYASPEVIRTLLKAGADVKAKDIRGMTPLMLAVASETQDVEVVRLLLGAGSDVNAVSSAWETALDWARKFGSRPVIAALLAAGANEGTPHFPEIR